MRGKAWAIIGVSVIWTGTSALAVTGGQVDNFQSGTTANWAGASPSNIPSGGPTGAGDRYLQLDSAANPNLAGFNLVQWAGNYQAEGIADIGVDFRNPNASPLHMRMVLIGPSGSRWTSANPAIVPADSAWHHYTFSLRQADVLNVLDLGDTYAATIAGVERLLIRHEVTPGSGGTSFTGILGVDNITAVVPEPSALGLLAAGALILRRRRM